VAGAGDHHHPERLAGPGPQGDERVVLEPPRPGQPERVDQGPEHGPVAVPVQPGQAEGAGRQLGRGHPGGGQGAADGLVQGRPGGLEADVLPVGAAGRGEPEHLAAGVGDQGVGLGAAAVDAKDHPHRAGLPAEA
jgi:hypothetical protein